jgi:hypothetical protein
MTVFVVASPHVPALDAAELVPCQELDLSPARTSYARHDPQAGIR